MDIDSILVSPPNPTKQLSLPQAILRTVAYSDLFEFPLTQKEIHVVILFTLWYADHVFTIHRWFFQHLKIGGNYAINKNYATDLNKRFYFYDFFNCADRWLHIVR